MNAIELRGQLEELARAHERRDGKMYRSVEAGRIGRDMAGMAETAVKHLSAARNLTPAAHAEASMMVRRLLDEAKLMGEMAHEGRSVPGMVVDTFVRHMDYALDLIERRRQPVKWGGKPVQQARTDWQAARAARARTLKLIELSM